MTNPRAILSKVVPYEKLLMTPGPTMVDERVRQAMSLPVTNPDLGVFGEGFADFVKMYGGEPILVSGEYDRPVTKEQVAAVLERERGIKLATIVHCLLQWKKSWIERRAFPYTPPSSNLLGLRTAVELVLEEGLEQVIERHRRIGQAVRQALRAVGLELFPQ